MKALAKFGRPSDFGTYRMIDIPEPECGDNDIILEVKAAAICGADMKHYKVDNGSDEFGSVRGHEFAGEIVRVGKNVKDWRPGQRIVSDNTGHVCGRCPACERGDYLLCSEKVNLGLGYGYSGGFTKYCRIPGEILAIHKRAIWEIPEGLEYEEAAVMDPICNAYKAIAQRSGLLPGENVVIFGTGPLGLFSVQIAKIMGEYCTIPSTYAGGISSFEDLDNLKELGRGKIDFTIGSALDIFGGNMNFEKVAVYGK